MLALPRPTAGREVPRCDCSPHRRREEQVPPTTGRNLLPAHRDRRPDNRGQYVDSIGFFKRVRTGCVDIPHCGPPPRVNASALVLTRFPRSGRALWTRAHCRVLMCRHRFLRSGDDSLGRCPSLWLHPCSERMRSRTHAPLGRPTRHAGIAATLGPLRLALSHSAAYSRWVRPESCPMLCGLSVTSWKVSWLSPRNE